MVENFRTVETDVLVVGTGAAGMMATVEADRNNAKVIVVDKGIATKSGLTTCAPAPNARAISGRTLDFKLNLMRGCYLNDQDMLWKACSEGPEILKELDTWTKKPGIETWNYSVNSEAVKHPGIRVLDYVMITKLLTKNGKIVGATGLDIVNGEFILFKTKAVILATGGYAEMYDHPFSVPQDVRTGVTGDGQALAYRAGCELCEMEMTTFELRGFVEVNRWLRAPIGTIGPFLDKDGKVVLSKDDILSLPCECAPPGSAAVVYQNSTIHRRVMQEIKKHGPLYYNKATESEESEDLSPASQSILNRARRWAKLLIFPSKDDPRDLSNTRSNESNDMLGMKDLMKDEAFRRDISKIQVLPSCRLGQGGPKVNVKGETSVPGLYGAGEGAGSGALYGAYRPGALIWTTVVQGKWAGENAAKYVKTVKMGSVDVEEVAEERDRLLNFLKPKRNPISPQEVKKKIREIAGENLYVIRNGRGLKQAIQEIEELRSKDLPRIQVVDVRRYNNDWVEALEVQNMLDVGEMIARSSLFRTESRGCFNRGDYPEMDNENWLCHTLLKKEKGKMMLSKGKVVMTKFKPPSVEECLKGGEPIPIKGGR